MKAHAHELGVKGNVSPFNGKYIIVNIVFMQVVLLLGNGMAGTRLLNHNL
jgi:hypothetical protein